MARKQLPFEAAARRSILGEKCELKSMDGYWFRPRKYSVPGAEEIEAAGGDLSKELPATVIKKLIPMYQNKDISEITEAAIMEELGDDELAELMKLYMGNQRANTSVAGKILLHGIGEHNFFDQDNASRDVTNELVDALLEYAETAGEMIVAIKRHNSPLPRSTPETSPMSQSGSTEETISASNVPTSTTEETPSS